MTPLRLTALVLTITLTASCGSRPGAPAADTSAPNAMRPIVVQGAMAIEVRTLVAALEHPEEDQVEGWTFWRGTIGGVPVVVSKTLKGTANAAAATALAAERYHPIAIINQGTAGGHDPALHVADIVLGKTAVNIGSFKTGDRGHGAGSSIADWKPMDLIQSDGSAGQDPRAWQMHRFEADAALLAAAQRVKDRYTRGRVVDGVIGSSDMWNSELDRITHFHDQFGTSVEEMETAAAAQVAGLAGVPFLGIRILSNNITNGDAYDGGTAEACERFVIEVIQSYAKQRDPH
jgi:adenosylhomocysteine nucleosidase